MMKQLRLLSLRDQKLDQHGLQIVLPDLFVLPHRNKILASAQSICIRVALIAIGIVLTTGCMNRKPAPVCPIPTEIKSSDPGMGGFEGVDILVVVDNSISMTEEQEILATAFFPLVNTLINPTASTPFAPSDDVRIAITTSDMGVSYGGKPYTKEFKAHKECVNPLKNGMGDNGKFVDEYRTPLVNLLENTIPCDEDASQCPTGWTCDMSSGEKDGRCMDPNGDGSAQSCPASPKSQNLRYLPENYDMEAAAFTVACLADVGTEGCAFEQQLAASVAGLNHDESFIRRDSLTAVIVVSDEEDCSIESDQWHDLEELGGTEMNVACGKHKGLLTDIEVIKERLDAAKTKVSDDANGMLFAAIIGVPPVQACQGRGYELDDCLAQPLETGTVGDPKIIEREGRNGTPGFYYEFACERKDDEGIPITQAFAGARYVELAQQYQNMSYVYSICNEDWSTAMVDIAELIAENMNGTCYGKRLSWNPETETANCNVVFEYATKKSEASSAPPCPDLEEKYGYSDIGWEEESPVTTIPGEDGEMYWLRSCAVKKIPAPLNCSDFEDAKDANKNKFGWYYCENPGENNSVACNDDLDNDRDGLKDEEDDDCDVCSGKENGSCPSDCPYKVSISKMAMKEVSAAYSANVVCLQQYRFEDPNCKEGTFHACNDGQDNDGNGPFDCHSYSKQESDEDLIPEEHFPDANARIADPDCCPMRRNPDGGACEFLNARGEPAVEPSSASWAHNCGVDEVTPENMPDACCEASTALLCKLPTEYRLSCEARGN